MRYAKDFIKANSLIMPFDIDLDELSANYVPPVETEKEKILSIIYAPDPETGQPTGDYALYLSDKTNPAVRNYIVENLLRPVESTNVIPSSIDGDFSDLMRGQYETPREYMLRVDSYMRDEKRRLVAERESKQTN